MIKQAQTLKDEFIAYKNECHRFFLRQGSFSLYHCKKMDGWIERAYDAVLRAYFEDFLPSPQLVPFCVIARKHYANNGLCFDEHLPLIFVYKDLKIYQLKAMIKSLIGLLNDMGLQLDFMILELEGIQCLCDELQRSIIQTRFICGSKFLFKEGKEKFERLLNTNKTFLAQSLFSPYHTLAFSPQEFDVKKVCGGLEDLRRLDDLLALFKNAPKNYALNFIDEKALSKLRLARDFLLSFQSALNLQSGKDEDDFFMQNAEEIADLMYKKDKKNAKAASVLVEKILHSIHTIHFYDIFLSQEIRREKTTLRENLTFSSLNEALHNLAALNDVRREFSAQWVYALHNLSLDAMEEGEALAIFEKFFEREHSFGILKLLLDSGKLDLFLRPLQRFLCNEEGVYSFDVEAFLLIEAFERSSMGACRERKILKLVLLFSALGGERGGVFRAFCGKWELSLEHLELGLCLFKNFNALKDIVEKEDIYNPLIISNLLSRLRDFRSLEWLYFLTELRMRVLKMGDFFFRVLTKLFENAKDGFSDTTLLEEGARRLKKEHSLKKSEIFLRQDRFLQDKIMRIKSNLFIIKNSSEDIVKIAAFAREGSFKFWLNTKMNLSLEIIANKDFKLECILNVLARYDLIFMSFYELFDDKIYLKFEYAHHLSPSRENKLYALLNSQFMHPVRKKIKKPLIKKDELKLDLNYSKIYAKLNLNAKDQQGLMAFIMNIFSLYNLHLSTAKIQTIRQRTRNVFIFQKNEALLKNQERLINSLVGE